VIRARVLYPLALLSMFACPLQAQREALVVRAEQFGGSSIASATGTTMRSVQQGLSVTAAKRVLLQDGNLMLLLGAQYRGMAVDLPSNTESSTGLHVLAADLWMLRTLNDAHSLVVVLRPGVYGDLRDIGSQVRLEGAAFVDRVFSPRTTVGLGLSYASSFGEVLPIPVLHVLARPARQVLVDALLPARADVWWLPRKGLDVGLNVSLNGAQYGLSDAARPTADVDALQLSNATLGPQVRWTPARGKWQLTADGGVTVLRRLRYAAEGQVQADLSPGNVPFVRLGVQRLF
jgi:hypothetical protein